jgi:trimeric autotransporter adhesin
LASHRLRLPSSLHAWAAGTSRLGSIADWSRKSSTQRLPAAAGSSCACAGSSSPASAVSASAVSASAASASVRRKVARAGPVWPRPTPSQAASSSASASSSTGSASNRPSGADSASSQASIADSRSGRRLPRGGTRSGPAPSSPRAIASTIAVKAAPTSSTGSSRPGTARQTGGMALVKAWTATTSGPERTGRQLATAPSESRASAGSTRPRVTSSPANSARSAR